MSTNTSTNNRKNVTITPLLIMVLLNAGRSMTNKDHSLDSRIIQAAYSEFLAYGFQKASLHKIAEKAGVTTGAIYTRYKNKDALFLSLLQNFFEAEEQIYFQLLTEHYDDCTLFFCRSDGSSVETMLDELMDRKTEQTVEFFSHIYGKEPNADAIRLLMGSQFWYFRRLLSRQLEKDRMFACLRSVLDFTNAGWQQLCNTLQ